MPDARPPGTPRFLVVEDSEADFLLLQGHLDRHGPAANCQRVWEAAGLKLALAEAWDLALVDFAVPGLDFHTVVGRLRAAQPELPVILVSGALSEHMALEMLHLGLADFVLKSSLARLPGAIRRALDAAAERRARRAGEEHYRLLLEQLPDGVFLADAQGRYLDVNWAGAVMLGYSREEILSLSIPDILDPDEVVRLPGEIARFAGGAVVTSEWRFRRKDGSGFIGEVVGRRLPDGRLQGVLRDITQRRQAEEQVSRELEAMAHLRKLGTLDSAPPGDLNSLLQEVVDTAIAISDADFGNIQLLDPASGDLRIAAQRGFPPWWLDFWDRVAAGQGSCGTALARGERVIVEDVERSPIFAGTPALDIQRRAGVRAVLSTPLIGRSGQPLGMFSTHYRAPRRPDERALRLLDLLARQAADMIERAHYEEALRESESFYRQTLESIPGMVFTTRPDGYCDYQSQQWVDYTGVPMSEHMGDGWNTLLHPDDRPRAYAAWRAAVEERAPYDLEYRVRRHDGVYEWFRVIGRPIRDASGGIARWFGVAVNIERLKSLAAEIAERETLLHTITENIPDAIFVMGRDHRQRYLNPAAVADINAGRNALLTPSEMLGKSVVELFGDSAESRAKTNANERVMASGLQEMSEDSLVTLTGLRTLLATRVPLYDADGKMAGLVGIAHDITERKQAEANRLAALERQRDALVREVHHRIKNHLQGVTGLLRNAAADTPAIAAPLELAIGRIRAIAQVYGLQSRRDDARVCARDLVELALAGAAAPIDFQKRVEAEFDLTNEDAVPVALAINELVTNAVKHRERSEAGRAVRIRLEGDAEAARLEIASGPARLPHGFDYGGGLGLGTGLELVSTLLPPDRTRIEYRQRGDEVACVLTLRKPWLTGFAAELVEP